jgi:hypothetical protein
MAVFSNVGGGAFGAVCPSLWMNTIFGTPLLSREDLCRHSIRCGHPSLFVAHRRSSLTDRVNPIASELGPAAE